MTIGVTVLCIGAYVICVGLLVKFVQGCVNNGIMSIYEFLEDFDNSELDESEWQEQMEEAVLTYNDEYDASLKPPVWVRNYKLWKRDKLTPEQ